MRDRFEEAGIPVGYIDPEEAPYRRYVRVVEEANVDDDEGKTLLEKLWENVLRGAKILIQINPDAVPPPGSIAAE